MIVNQTIKSGRAELATESVGSGNPLVFLHARIADRRMWRAQLDAVGASHRAVAYDRRGFGETDYERENFSAVEDLIAVLDAATGGKPATLVGCSQGGGIALDAALRYPSLVHALVLIAPNVTGAPEEISSPTIERLLAQLKEAEANGNVDQIIALRTRLFLDGPLAAEGRVTGRARQLFFDMNAVALSSLPVGSNLDTAPAYHRLSEISVPSLVICGDIDLPNIRDRSRYVAATVLNGSYHEMAGVAHLPSLERPAEITTLLTEFINGCSDR